MRHKLVYRTPRPHINLIRGIILAIVIMDGFSASAESLVEPEILAISSTHQAFLTRLTRRTIRDVTLGRERYEPEYIPEELQHLKIEVVVRLRHSGFLLAMTSAGPSPAAIAVRDASHQSMKLIMETMDGAHELLPEILIEIEAAGEAQPFEVKADWTKPGVLNSYIEPGVHGMVLVGPNIQHRFCPTEIITSNRLLSEALKDIVVKAQSTNYDIFQCFGQ